jgi:hypothetical protein
MITLNLNQCFKLGLIRGRLNNLKKLELGNELFYNKSEETNI